MDPDWRWKKMAMEAPETVSGSELSFAILNAPSNKALCHGLNILAGRWGAEELACKLNEPLKPKSLFIFEDEKSKGSSTVFFYITEEIRGSKSGDENKRAVYLLDFGADPDVFSGDKSVLEHSLLYADMQPNEVQIYIIEAMLSKSKEAGNADKIKIWTERFPRVATSICKEFAKRQKNDLTELIEDTSSKSKEYTQRL